MKRTRRSKQAIAAQRLNALAIARPVETKIRHLRNDIRLEERRLAADRGVYSAHLYASHIKRLESRRPELAALESQQAPAMLPAIVLGAMADLDPRWLLLDAAATRLGVHPAHLARRCRQTLARQGLAVRVAVQGGAGPLRWAVARSIDPRLAEPAATNEATSEG